MRIISGTCRGRKLTQIQGKETRPTSDRVREALFNIIGPGILGASVLDLFAGTGALGLEALSRGAKKAVFLENSPGACKTIRENISLCKMEERAFLYQHDIMGHSLPQTIAGQTFDLIFIDPPYRQGLLEACLDKPGLKGLLSREGTIIAEQSAREPLVNKPIGLDIYRQKKYSKTFISFLRHS